jgi:hypothetical protein
MEQMSKIILESGRSIAAAIDELCTRKNFSVDERVMTAQVALTEIMAKWEGQAKAIEQLRNLADILERQVMSGEIGR